MKNLMIFALTFAAGAANAVDTGEQQIRIRPSRTVAVTCLQSGQETTVNGSSNDLTILRVGENVVKYEVYQDDFFIASCDNVHIQGQ